jgi:hypothetical protein
MSASAQIALLEIRRADLLARVDGPLCNDGQPVSTKWELDLRVRVAGMVDAALEFVKPGSFGVHEVQTSL